MSVGVEHSDGPAPGHVDVQTRQGTDRSRPGKILFTPVLAAIVKDRRIALVLVAASAIQLCLTCLGLPGWQCPIRASLGIPCPGCGLSRAMGLMIQGEWQAALSTHVFAPVFFAGITLVSVAAVLPDLIRRRLVAVMARVEERTGFVFFLLMGIIGYWVFRLPSMQW